MGSPGYVYILVNSAMPGLVKVGKTARDTHARAAELSAATGVPVPFVVAFQEHFVDCDAAETFLHTELERRGVRAARNREFFQVAPNEVVRIIMDMEGRSEAAQAGSMADTAERSLVEAPAKCITWAQAYSLANQEQHEYAASKWPVGSREYNRNIAESRLNIGVLLQLPQFSIERAVLNSKRATDDAASMAARLAFVKKWEKRIGVPGNVCGTALMATQAYGDSKVQAGPWETAQRQHYLDLANRLGEAWDTPPAVLDRMSATDCQHAGAMRNLQSSARFWRKMRLWSIPPSLLLIPWVENAWPLLVPVVCWLLYKPAHLNVEDDLKKR